MKSKTDILIVLLTAHICNGNGNEPQFHFDSTVVCVSVDCIDCGRKASDENSVVTLWLMS